MTKDERIVAIRDTIDGALTQLEALVDDSARIVIVVDMAEHLMLGTKSCCEMHVIEVVGRALHKLIEEQASEGMRVVMDEPPPDDGGTVH